MIIKRKLGDAVREGLVVSSFGAIPGAGIGALMGGKRGALVGI